MSKVSKNYLIIWGIMLAVFNLIVFIAPGWGGLEKYTGAFWVAYAFTMIAFVAHLLLTLWAFKDAAESKQRLFLNIPIITISYTGMVLTIIVGALCMLNSLLPVWAAVIVMAIMLLLYGVSIAKTMIAIDAVEEVQTKVATSTAFIKSLRAEADSLVGMASPSSKALCTKVVEAIRYADPVSNELSMEVESELKSKLGEFAAAVKSGDDAKTNVLGNEVLSLIKERNVKCRAGK